MEFQIITWEIDHAVTKNYLGQGVATGCPDKRKSGERNSPRGRIDPGSLLPLTLNRFVLSDYLDSVF